MRAFTKVGDIFEISLQNGKSRYFQYIAKDRTNLNADVIRVFRRSYVEIDSPQIDTIILDEIEYYLHTSVSAGVKIGVWKRFGSSQKLGNLDISFRISLDSFESELNKAASKKWVVWQLNKERCFVGRLPGSYHDAGIGMVYSPITIYNWLQTGKYPYENYPTF